jgi:glyoxylase-like metal-dependent hydrolase (beta-lactamase superfamily II)
MIFKQLFDKDTCTYTYFLADQETRESLLIDPVLSHTVEYKKLLFTFDCTLKYSLETHVHADHLSAGAQLRDHYGAAIGINENCGVLCADMQLAHGDELLLGNQRIKIIGTSGHTPGSTSFLIGERLFTGDSLLILGCGRTDFQGGDAGDLYDSIVNCLFTLPDETLVFPGHDYHGRRVSCIGQERSVNPRLAGKSRNEFIQIMNNLNLPKPKMIDIAVSANRHCGISEQEQSSLQI